MLNQSLIMFVFVKLFKGGQGFYTFMDSLVSVAMDTL